MEPIILKNHRFMIFAKSISTLVPLCFYIYANVLENMELSQDGPVILLISLIGLPLLFLALTGLYYLDWKFKTLYQYSDRLVYEKGILHKTRTTVRYDRVASVDIHRPLFFRFFGLSNLKIDSNAVGSSDTGKSEIVITMGLAEAEYKRQQLLSLLPQGQAADGSGATGQQQPLFVLNRGRVMAMLLLSGFLSVALLVPYAVSVAFAIVIPYLHFPFAQVILYGTLILLGILAIMTLGAFVISLLAYFRFTLYQMGDAFHITYGLLDIKSITIPFHKINGIRVSQNLFQKFLGLCSVSVLSAGYGDEGNELQSVIAPSANQEEAMALIKAVYPHLPEFGDSMTPTPSSLPLFFCAPALVGVVMVLLIICGVPATPVLSIGLVTVAILLIAAGLRYANTSLSKADRFMRLDKGGIFRTTVYLPLSRCQSLDIRSGPLQRLLGKAHLTFWLFAPKMVSQYIRLRHMQRDATENFDLIH